jgi:hypothetical protein
MNSGQVKTLRLNLKNVIIVVDEDIKSARHLELHGEIWSNIDVVCATVKAYWIIIMTNTEILKEFAEKLISSQQDTTPEFEKVFRDNFRKLLVNSSNEDNEDNNND